MNLRKRRRIAFVAALLIAGGGAAVLIAAALKDNVLYFYGPGDVVAHRVGYGVAFRVGGLVAVGSVRKGGGEIRFILTDGKAMLPVVYRGLPPALFAEGQGAVAAGKLDASGVFFADQLLARHDEKYMPPEAVEALKRSGRWKEGEVK